MTPAAPSIHLKKHVCTSTSCTSPFPSAKQHRSLHVQPTELHWAYAHGMSDCEDGLDRSLARFFMPPCVCKGVMIGSFPAQICMPIASFMHLTSGQYDSSSRQPNQMPLVVSVKCETHMVLYWFAWIIIPRQMFVTEGRKPILGPSGVLSPFKIEFSTSTVHTPRRLTGIWNAGESRNDPQA